MAKAKVSQSHQPKKSDPQPPLGNLIAAILAHPETPERVYNGIVDALNELQRSEVSNSAPFIQALIDGYNLEEQKGTFKAEGGAA